MPLLILGSVLFASVALYMYVLNNQERFAKKYKPKKGPFNVIYLPDDLEAYKNKNKKP